MKLQWAVLLMVAVLLLIGSLAFNSSAGRIVVAAPITPPITPVVTLDLPTLAPSGGSGGSPVAATPTRERYALTKPATEEDVAEPLLTLTAMSDVLNAQPTPTDRPETIEVDGKPHLLDFNAWWCSPCNQMRPYIADMEAKYGDQVTFDDINVDNRGSQKLNQKYRVQYIPLIVLLDKDGNEVNRLDGYHTEQELDDALSQLVAGQ